MPLDGASISFQLSVDAVSHDTTAQPDPNDALGGRRSTTDLFEFQGTVTNAFSPTVFLDGTRAADAPGLHNGKYVQIVTGTNFLAVARIAESLGAVFRLETPLPSSGSIGDTYQIYDVNNLFDDVDAAESAAGDTEYRLVYVTNGTGVTLTTARLYMRMVDPGNTSWRIASTATATGAVDIIADEDTAPDLEADAEFGFPDVLFTEELQPTASQPASLNNMTTGHRRPVWVERTIGPSSFPRETGVVQLIIVADNTGGDPDPITSACLIPFGVVGFTPLITVAQDRKAYIGGGCRVLASVQNADADIPIEGPVEWELTSGPGTLFPGSDDETDADGLDSVVYKSSETPGDAGLTAVVTAKV